MSGNRLEGVTESNKVSRSLGPERGVDEEGSEVRGDDRCRERWLEFGGQGVGVDLGRAGNASEGGGGHGEPDRRLGGGH